MTTEQIPTDDQIRIAMFQTLEQMRQHATALTELTVNLNEEARVHRAQIKSMAETMDANAEVANANADVINENEARVQQERNVAAAKELATHLFEKGHQYVTVVMGGAFAAYFATLGTLASRFSDTELRVSALLMTISLAVFALWEVVNIAFLGHHSMKGDYGFLAVVPRWQRIGWYIAMVITLGTAIPAICLSVYVYLRGLGVFG